jgi:hypothetical protein
MEAFKTWEDMTDLEQAQCTYWDMYKDAYGHRPRGVDTSTWTLADFEQEFASLGSVIQREHADRQTAQAQAITKFESHVTSLMHTGADRERVIAWLMDAEHANGDADYFCFTQGLPYGYFRKAA